MSDHLGDDSPRISIALRQQLREASTRGPAIPNDLDSGIRATIDERFASRARASAWRAWAGSFAAVAAIVVVAVCAKAWFEPHRAEMSIAPERRLAAALSLVESLEGQYGFPRAQAIGNPGVQALLAFIVAMPNATKVSVPDGAGFAIFDLYVDPSGAAFAAWQCELALPGRIVGIEGGDGAFSLPATHDAAALAGDRVILASIGSNAGTSVRIRVASVTVHLSDGDAPPTTSNQSACASGGAAVPAKFELLKRTP